MNINERIPSYLSWVPVKIENILTAKLPEKDRQQAFALAEKIKDDAKASSSHPDRKVFSQFHFRIDALATFVRGAVERARKTTKEMPKTSPPSERPAKLPPKAARIQPTLKPVVRKGQRHKPTKLPKFSPRMHAGQENILRKNEKFVNEALEAVEKPQGVKRARAPIPRKPVLPAKKGAVRHWEVKADVEMTGDKDVDVRAELAAKALKKLTKK
jgi:hypothetical protein